jgi:ubiquinone/menaquinone biosynthesis C-methylase UbiE
MVSSAPALSSSSELPSPQYLLGNSEVEYDRLIRQANRLAPVSERLFRDAGIGPGQRVLDLGSGVGDVAMLLARLVGPSGKIVAVERDPRSIDRAVRRAAVAGLRNITFVEVDLMEFAPDATFDAVVGRWILQFLPDPVAILRAVTPAVRPGGAVAFQEVSFAPFMALGAHLPLWSLVTSLHHGVAKRVGVNTEMGPGLHQTFLAAGLPMPHMRVEIELGCDADFTQNLADATISILPHIERLQLEPLGDLDTLEQRLADEVAAARTVVPWFPLVAAWCRV